MKKMTCAFALSTMLLGTFSPTVQAIAETNSTIPKETSTTNYSEKTKPSLYQSSAPNITANSTTSTTSNEEREQSQSQEDTQKVLTTTTVPSQSTTNTTPVEEDTLSDDIASGTWGTVPWTIDSEGTLLLESGTTSDIYISPWDDYSLQIKKIVFEGKVIGSGSASSLFNGLANVEDIQNLNNFDTSAITDMSFMFSGMTSLVSLDLSGFNTSKVASMRSMFEDDEKLSSLNLSNFDTSSVTSMYGMFNECFDLESLDLSNFNTSKVTSMGMMFSNMFAMKNLNICSFDTSNVTNMFMMFDAATVLEKIDVSNFNTSKVTSMGAMFANMYKITSLDLSSFDTTNVENLRSLFDRTPLEQLRLGENTTLDSAEHADIKLANPISDEKFTGKWQTVGTGTAQFPNGNWKGNSTDLVNKSAEHVAETYVWEPVLTAAADVTVKYLDTAGNKISDNVVKSGNVGDTYSTEQKTIDGYTFKEVQGNATGTFTDQAQTVTYVYTKDPVAGGDVTAKYVDTAGNKISDDVVKSGNVGDAYSTEQKTIDGYTFKEVQGNATGTFTDQAQTVTYVYTKNKVTPSPKPDDHADTPDSSKDNGKKHDSTSENKNTLPQTGDNEGLSMIGMISGLFLIIGTSLMILFKRKRQD
ncbi:BspA family leucine-rich repeat surface protein [Lactococcus lactis]|uniref:BspA family leucine-rich repeat surface protein n=1 Tax=Lactococcus lactis TaxID=1358 RepID=A0A9X4S612_9LACT|nr:MucBP domain-containing protein [Lactococcus lactis]MDG4983871.1 BspA family leucine-rich repeat surface protein [Lactococcus lactis]